MTDDDEFSYLTNGTGAPVPDVSLEEMAAQADYLAWLASRIPTHFACNSRTVDRVRAALPLAAAHDPIVYDMPIVVDEDVPDGIMETRYGKPGDAGKGAA